MSVDRIAEFEASLERHSAILHRCRRENVADVLSELARAPTVGVPLPGAADLPDHVITRPSAGDVDAARTGITPAVLGIAEYGSILLASDPDGTEAVSLYPEHHIAVLREENLCSRLREAFETLGPWLRDGNSGVLATGPSATADMGELVLGAHGPREVDVVLTNAEDGTRDGGTEVTSQQTSGMEVGKDE